MPGRPKRLWVAITNHYESLGGKVSAETAVNRVVRWQEAWPRIAVAAPRDADGKRPCYSFFYPEEEYRPELLAPLAEMITGPLGLRYFERLAPRSETGELASYDPPSKYRVKRWFDLACMVGDDTFLKLYTRAAREDNADALLETGSKAGGLALQWLHEAAAERPVELHWASAYEMFCAVEALAHGSRPATAQGVPAATGAEAC